MKLLFAIAVLTLPACATARSEVAVEVRQQADKPEYVVTFRIQN